MPIQTGRPFGVIGSFAWSATGAGFILADDSDSTYYSYNILFGNFLDPLVAQIPATPLPPGAAVRYCIANVRMAYPTGSPLPTMQVTIRDANSNALAANQVLITASPTTYGAVAAFISAAQAAQVLLVTVEEMPFSQSAFQPIQGPVAVRVYEIIFSVYYATKPSVVVTAPTGTITSSSSPTVTWTYTPGADGTGQQAYRVVVYDTATFSAGNFSPGQSGGDFDTGIVYGNTPSQVVGPLANDTYRAYVQAAQLVNGQLHWSDWAFTGFVQNISPPSAPSISAAAVSASARIDLTITGSGNSLSVLDVYEVQRTNDGGITWIPVRGDLGQYISTIGGARNWSDYESGNAESVQYRARTVSTTSDGFTYISAWSSNTSSVNWSSSSSWLKVPGKPNLNRQCVIQDFGDDVYEINQAVNQGLGSKYPTVQSGLRRQLASGTVALLVSTTAERTALDTIVQEPIILLQPANDQVNWGSRYLVPSTATAARKWTPKGWDPRRAYQLPYTQIPQPSVVAYPMVSGGNTWQSLVNTYATWATIPGTLTWAQARQ